MKLDSLALILTLLALSPSAPAQTAPASPRPITIDDYFQIQAVHDAQLSPDSRWVAYSVDKGTLETEARPAPSLPTAAQASLLPS